MREAGVCPHCGHESKPWTHHAGLWWCQSQSGDWQWLDEKAGIWRWYKDGTPTDPSATDRTPSLLVDPASVTPPDEPEAGLPSPAEPDPGVSSPVDGLEQLAALHARGALTDEEFQAAKARMLGL